jgi:acyl-coenzyme A thioesterase PaaI-like protein
MTSASTSQDHVLAIDDREIRQRAACAGLSARVELADAARALLSRLARTRASDEQLSEVTSALLRAGRALDEAPEQCGYLRSIEGALTGLGALSELGPFTGRLHALAPLGRLTLGTKRAEALVTYDSAHEGAPGFVHGGFIAAYFDEMLGVVQRDTLRMTVSLEMRYRAPTPLHREVRYTSWLERVDGRKAFVAGALHEGDRLCAEASAVFVAPRADLFDQSAATPT